MMNTLAWFHLRTAVPILGTCLVIGSLGRAATAGDLYLFSEIPFSTWSSDFPNVTTALRRLAGGRLDVIPATAPPPAPRFVISDTELRLLAIGGSPSMPSGFQLMSMDAPGKFRDFEIDVPGGLGANGNVEEAPQQGPLLIFRVFNDDALSKRKPLVETLMGLDIATGKWADTSPDMYRYVRITGGVGGYVSQQPTDAVGLEQFDGGQLVIPVAQRVIPIMPPLPPGLRFTEKDQPWLLLSNRHLMAVADWTRDSTRTQPDGRTRVAYRVLDKSNNRWIGVEVPGAISWNVRAFGPWIAGIVDEDLHGKAFRLSPARRRSVDRNPVITADDYLETEEIYRTGKLFLYQVPQHRYYEWDTGDGDCEIILIDNDQVYYRVDQRIYRAKIGDKQLGKPELLVEDAVVPGIHWAFFGPSSRAAARR